ncbi:MAG: hypothetical protein LBI77_02765 [Puniceicoccales bacterium]|nr:hypothetical protein [Puniceicoccales bacterium]
MAAVTVISRATVANQYDYRTFFFGDVFRSGVSGSPQSPAFAANPFLPNHFFYIFGQNIPTPAGPVSLLFSGNWQTVAPGRIANQAHSEGAFGDFLSTPAAVPFDSRANLMTHVANTMDILAFIIHLKNKKPICKECQRWAVNTILTHLCALLMGGAVAIVNPLSYDPPMKGMHLSPVAAAAAAAAPIPIHGLQGRWGNHFPLDSVISPSFPGGVPIPAMAGTTQIVRIVFIIGDDFKNVDIFE